MRQLEVVDEYWIIARDSVVYMVFPEGDAGWYPVLDAHWYPVLELPTITIGHLASDLRKPTHITRSEPID